ncbi:MAG: glycosyltransferase [Desulfobacterales bacterium]|nr:glycosyltransferase [Desulfobacterales bacterium]
MGIVRLTMENQGNKKKHSAYNIICFGFLPWNNMWGRNQSMMAEIAQFHLIHNVIFVDPLLSIRKVFMHKSKHLNTSSHIAGKLFPSKKTSKIWEYVPLTFLPFKRRFSALEKLENRINLNIIRLINSNMPFILFINSPKNSLQYLLDELLKKADLSIFDFCDDFVEYYPSEAVEARAIFSRNIEKYAKSSDIVLSINDHLRNKYSFLNKNIHVIKNGTNYYNFDRKSYKTIDFLERIKSKKKPIIGYSGNINTFRIDFSLLDFLLDQRPNWQYVFIGPAESYFTKRYLKFENVYHVPPVDYQTLPDYIRYFDVAIVPFKINEHTKGNNLLKFHDYLAMGKPIVSTDMGGANDLRDVIRIAQRPSDFLEKVEKALSPDTFRDTLKRKKVALENSWQHRIKELEELIKNSIS